MPTWSVQCIEACSATGQPDEASASTFLIQHSHCRNGPRRVYMRTVSLLVADSGCVLNCHLLAPGPSGSAPPRANAAAKAGVIRFHNATSGPVAAAKARASPAPTSMAVYGSLRATPGD
jgi:hypothetical protein